MNKEEIEEWTKKISKTGLREVLPLIEAEKIIETFILYIGTSIHLYKYLHDCEVHEAAVQVAKAMTGRAEDHHPVLFRKLALALLEVSEDERSLGGNRQ